MRELAVILPAAGSAVRFGADKLRADLLGRSVLARTVDAFLAHPDVRQIVIPTREPEALRLHVPADPRLSFCIGGRCRADSVQRGLARVSEAIKWLAVHDAARPLVTQVLIDRTFAAALEYGAAVPARPVALTIKQAVGPLPAQVQRTVPRDQLWAMQTPQIMRRADLIEAFAAAPIPLEQVTDDVQLLELAGKPVWLVEGEERNLKITTPLDLQLAELILRADGAASDVLPPPADA